MSQHWCDFWYMSVCVPAYVCVYIPDVYMYLSCNLPFNS